MPDQPDPRIETIRQALRALDREAVSAHHLPVALAALDSLAADLAEPEHFRNQSGIAEPSRDWRDGFLSGQATARDAAHFALAAAETRLTSAQEAVASALTSLATGPGRDGYAYAVLSEWLADTTEQDTQP